MSFLSDPNGTIRRRKPISQRRNEGIIRFGSDNTSQSGEDGIIRRLFDLIPLQTQIWPNGGGGGDGGIHNITGLRWCVDVGAWDGIHLSNTFSLLCPSEASKYQNGNQPNESRNEIWKGVLIEADGDKFQQLKKLHDPIENTCINITVSCNPNSTKSLSNILKNSTPKTFPKNFELIIIDVDGTDYWLLHDLLNSSFRPQVICVEFNPSMPHDLIYIQPRDDNVRHGSSLSALVELASKFNYQLCETTCYNAFFVDRPLYDKYIKADIPFEPCIESLHEVTMGTNLYQLYDGSLKLSGCKKLLWHRIPILERDIQVLKNEDDRSFPFVPVPNATNLESGALTTFSDKESEYFESISIDMSPYCLPPSSSSDDSNLDNMKNCSKNLVETIKSEGFALVRGTGIPKKVVQQALKWTDIFLQKAPEAVRRSCLTKDRARRGYSPQNSENFASLIGAKASNDLVRKFRVGPEEKDGDNFALRQANAWPPEELWEHSKEFQDAIEVYYEAVCDVAHTIVKCICDELNGFEERLVFSSIKKESHTSILTLLGYRKGARHQGCKKPLVAAHTDVGVVTVLLFDSGNVASLQRAKNDNWIDVKLPFSVSIDPIFVVNIGDCLSELCGSKMPSTMHRVMPKRGDIPRNCLALFVGLKPDQILEIGGEKITYEEWRRIKIAKAQERQHIKMGSQSSNVNEH